VDGDGGSQASWIGARAPALGALGVHTLLGGPWLEGILLPAILVTLIHMTRAEGAHQHHGVLVLRAKMVCRCVSSCGVA